ncbi:hypothetical protein GCM10023222_37570 [Saccharopolyspora cebuensis]
MPPAAGRTGSAWTTAPPGDRVLRRRHHLFRRAGRGAIELVFTDAEVAAFTDGNAQLPRGADFSAPRAAPMVGADPERRHA